MTASENARKSIIIFITTLVFLGISFTFIALTYIQKEDFYSVSTTWTSNNMTSCDKLRDSSNFKYFELASVLGISFEICEYICIACFALTLAIWIAWTIVVIVKKFVMKASFIMLFLTLFGTHLAFSVACLAFLFARFNDMCDSWCESRSSETCFETQAIACQGTCLDNVSYTSYVIALVVCAVGLLLFCISMITQFCIDRFKTCVEREDDEEYVYG